MLNPESSFTKAVRLAEGGAGQGRFVSKSFDFLGLLGASVISGVISLPSRAL